jgi:uncharacterized protein (TIGR00297 family)
LVSLTFGVVVWALRAGTAPAALCGAIICLLVTLGTERAGSWAEIRSGLAPLGMLFVLTFVAGRVGRAKTKAEVPPTSLRRTEFAKEERKGRSASQVVANLGAAGLVMFATFFGEWKNFVAAALLGVLAEATADTLSSETGSAFGGSPFLLTTFQRVEPGTDGAVSFVGTLAGAFGAATVAGVGVWAMGVSWQAGLCGFVGGVVGLGFDSLLGATVERRGWLGNDLVNFFSTVCAGLVAFGCALVL